MRKSRYTEAQTVAMLRDILDVLPAPRFVDLAPAQVYATRLDAGQYLCAERTRYRVLASQHEVRERRAQRHHPVTLCPNCLRPRRISCGAGTSPS